MNGSDDTVDSLSGAGSVSLSSYQLEAGGDNTSTTFSGVIGGDGGLTGEDLERWNCRVKTPIAVLRQLGEHCKLPLLVLLEVARLCCSVAGHCGCR